MQTGKSNMSPSASRVLQTPSVTLRVVAIVYHSMKMVNAVLQFLDSLLSRKLDDLLKPGVLG